jgi:NADPH-dependent curcumin reductase CurA
MWVREFDASHGINHKTSTIAGAVAKAVGPDGLQLVVDSVGGTVLAFVRLLPST